MVIDTPSTEKIKIQYKLNMKSKWNMVIFVN